MHQVNWHEVTEKSTEARRLLDTVHQGLPTPDHSVHYIGRSLESRWAQVSVSEPYEKLYGSIRELKRTTGELLGLAMQLSIESDEDKETARRAAALLQDIAEILYAFQQRMESMQESRLQAIATQLEAMAIKLEDASETLILECDTEFRAKVQRAVNEFS